MRRLRDVIYNWVHSGRVPVQTVPIDPDLIRTRMQIAALERRIDRLVEAYRKAGDAYAHRR